MQILRLKAKPREELGKDSAKKLRIEGLVPGVVYGGGDKPQHIILDEHDLRLILAKAGEHSLVEVGIGRKSPILALIAEAQHHPVTDRFLHVDFKIVPRDKPVEVPVSIEFVGESIGVHEGGIFMPRLHELNVRAKPEEVPDKIEVDISELDFDRAIHIEDIAVSEGIEILDEPKQTVATVVRPRIVVEEVEEVVEEVEEGVEVPAEGEEKAPSEEKETPKEE